MKLSDDAERAQQACGNPVESVDHSPDASSYQSHHHAHMNQPLQSQKNRQAEREILIKRLFDARGEPQPANDDHAEQSQDRQCAQQPELFADNGKNKISVGFGKIEKLLAALAQAASPHFSGTESDERLNDLKPAARCLAPWVHK